MAHVTFSATSSAVGTATRSLISDLTGASLPSQTPDGRLLGAIVRCPVAVHADEFRVRVVGVSNEVLWEEHRVGVWSSPVVIPAVVLPASAAEDDAWDIVATKIAGTDRVMSVEGIVDDNTALATPQSVATAVWDALRSSHVTSGTFGQGVVANSLAASAITATAIASGAITDVKIAAGAITSAKFAAGAINAAAFAADTITADKIATGAITADKIAADAITAVKIAGDAVTEIAAGVLGSVVEGTRTVAQTMRGLWSLGLTKASGFNTGTVALRSADDTKTRVTVATNATGRTGVTVGDLD